MFSVGIRVLLATRREGGTTEQLIGAAFVLLGVGGIPALFAGHEEFFAPSVQATVFATGQVLLSCAFGCFYLFAWRCFGPTSGWRRAFALLGVTVQVGVLVALGVIEDFQPPGGHVIRLAAISRGIVMMWALAESLHYWRLMRRRQELGLVDPLITNRFALWSCWTGGLVGAVAVAITARFMRTEITIDFSNAIDSALLLTAVAVLSVSVVTLFLAFFPPDAYVRWVRGGQAAS